MLFVRYLAVAALGPNTLMSAEEDQEAQAMFQQARAEAERQGVQVRTIYAVSYDVAETILDMAVTHGVDALYLGVSQRGAMWARHEGRRHSAGRPVLTGRRSAHH